MFSPYGSDSQIDHLTQSAWGRPRSLSPTSCLGLVLLALNAGILLLSLYTFWNHINGVTLIITFLQMYTFACTVQGQFVHGADADRL